VPGLDLPSTLASIQERLEAPKKLKADISTKSEKNEETKHTLVCKFRRSAQQKGADKTTRNDNTLSSMTNTNSYHLVPIKVREDMLKLSRTE